MIEKTLLLIKPDVSGYDLAVEDILRTLDNCNIRVERTKIFKFSKIWAQLFYSNIKNQPYFDTNIDFICSDYCIALVLFGIDAISKTRQLVGRTKPLVGEQYYFTTQTIKGSIVHSGETFRSKWGIGLPNNAIHASNSNEDFEREIAIIDSIIL